LRRENATVIDRRYIERRYKSLGSRGIASMLVLVPDALDSSASSQPVPPSLPRAKSPWKFWVVWTFDLLIALGFLYFFLTGLGTATVFSTYIIVWLPPLAGLGAILGGGAFLQYKGQGVWAAVVLCLLAIPAVLAALFFLVLILSNPRWN
jgi:hypothetical protein